MLGVTMTRAVSGSTTPGTATPMAVNWSAAEFPFASTSPMTFSMSAITCSGPPVRGVGAFSRWQHRAVFLDQRGLHLRGADVHAEVKPALCIRASVCFHRHLSCRKINAPGAWGRGPGAGGRGPGAGGRGPGAWGLGPGAGGRGPGAGGRGPGAGGRGPGGRGPGCAVFWLPGAGDTRARYTILMYRPPEARAPQPPQHHAPTQDDEGCRPRQATSRLARRLYRRQQQPHQNRDDHQQFDDRERAW